MTKRMVGSRKLLAGAFASAALLAGCGGSDDESTTSTAATDDRAEFIAQADAICREGAAVLDAAVTATFGNQEEAPSTKELIAFFTEETLPQIQAQFDEIAALPRPEADEEEIQALVDAGNEAVAESEADPDLLLIPQGGPTPFDEANQLARELGLQDCGAADPDAGEPAS